MVKILEFDFDETAGSTTASDSIGMSGQNGVFHGDATTDGSGTASFDGTGDYMEIASDPLFDLSQGTISMTFTLDSLPDGDLPYGATTAATLFSVDSSGLDGGGHLTIYIESDGALSARHQTDSGQEIISVGQVTPGAETTFEYEWSPTGGTLIMNGVSATTSTAFTLAGDVEPITLGASQAQSGDGVANNMQVFRR